MKSMAKLENGCLILSDGGSSLIIEPSDKLALERLSQIISQARAWAKRAKGNADQWPEFFAAARRRGKPPWRTSWGSSLLNAAVARLVAGGELDEARWLASHPDCVAWPTSRVTGAAAAELVDSLVAAAHQGE